MVSYDPSKLLVFRVPSFTHPIKARFLSWLLLTAGASLDTGALAISANTGFNRTPMSCGPASSGQRCGQKAALRQGVARCRLCRDGPTPARAGLGAIRLAAAGGVGRGWSCTSLQPESRGNVAQLRIPLEIRKCAAYTPDIAVYISDTPRRKTQSIK